MYILKITYEIYSNHEKWAPPFTSRPNVYGLIQCFLAAGANDAAIGVFGLSDHMKRLSADADGGSGVFERQPRWSAQRSSLVAWGGGPGYSYIPWRLVPWLRREGIDEEAIRRITVDNPARFLTWGARDA